jgi:hypothetical protein
MYCLIDRFHHQRICWCSDRITLYYGVSGARMQLGNIARLVSLSLSIESNEI